MHLDSLPTQNPPKNAYFEIDIRIGAFYVAGARCDTRICAQYPDLACMTKVINALEALYRDAFDVRKEIDIKELDNLVDGMPRRVGTQSTMT